MTTFGQAVRHRRLELGMTLQDVADRMGCTHQYVSKIEQGKHGLLRFTTCHNFAEAFDAPMHWGKNGRFVIGPTSAVFRKNLRVKNVFKRVAKRFDKRP